MSARRGVSKHLQRAWRKSHAVRPKKEDSKVLFELLGKVLPDYDTERVHASDVKKLFHWYNILLGAEKISLDNTTENAEEEPEKKVVAKKAQEPKTVAPKAPAATKTTTKAKAAPKRTTTAKKAIWGRLCDMCET